MKAVSKYDAAMRAVCADGRLHGMFKHYGAGPGRWSSVFVQLQNMMRPLIGDADVAIEACRQRDLNYLHTLYDLDPMKVVASCARGMLVAGEGKDFIALDFSQIEAVIRSWIAGDESMLQVFRDGKLKSYKVQGSKMFGLPAEKIVDEGSSQLYTAAKIGDLACGFQGYEAAVNKMARQMGIKLTMPAEDIANRWREANPRVVKTWGHLKHAARAAVEKPGEAYAIPNKRVSFKVVDRWLYMRLPSGRRLAYLDPQIDDGRYEGAVTHMGVNTLTRQWGRCDDYGGRWMQNYTEGVGRDVLTNGMLAADDAGYETTMTVHDEGVFEVDKGFGSLDEARRLMVTPMACHGDMPVKASGWRGPRYHKE
jgi:DNA polymerase